MPDAVSDFDTLRFAQPVEPLTGQSKKHPRGLMLPTFRPGNIAVAILNFSS